MNSLYSFLSHFSSLGKGLRLVASALSDSDDAITSPDYHDVITALNRAQTLSETRCTEIRPPTERRVFLYSI